MTAPVNDCTVAEYQLHLKERDYRFITLVHKGVVSWMPDSEQQHVNPQYRDSERNVPVTLSNLNEDDGAKMIAQVLGIAAKEKHDPEALKKSRSALIRQIISDFKAHGNSSQKH